MPTLNRSYGSPVQNGKANGKDDGQGTRASQDKPGGLVWLSIKDYYPLVMSKQLLKMTTCSGFTHSTL